MYKAKSYIFENWFYSFAIPQIGKEFDLIKIGKNRVTVNLELKSQNVYEEKIRKMAYDWFSGSFNGEFDSVGEYIVSCGVYGKIDNHELNAFLLNKEENQSRFRYIMRTAFPKPDYMQTRYPNLQKHPYLLPFYWLKRIFSTVFKSRESIRYRLKGVVQSDKSDFDRFDETGLR